MKYKKFISAFMLLNIFIAFSMIFVANKTREIEKQNTKIELKINSLKDEMHINLIEFTVHQNSDYLHKLYSIYFQHSSNKTNSKKISLKEFSKLNEDFKLVNAD